MVRFLQQTDLGRGNYTEERQQWLGNTDLSEIVQKIQKGEASPSLETCSRKLECQLYQEFLDTVAFRSMLRRGIPPRHRFDGGGFKWQGFRTSLCVLFWPGSSRAAGRPILVSVTSAVWGLANTGRRLSSNRVTKADTSRCWRSVEVAANRQATAAQKAQLETLTGAVAGAAEGAAAGAQFAGMLDSIGLESANVGQGALVGAAAGLVSGLASSFASGANETADETRRILLNCLRVTSRDGTLWQVVE